MRSSYKSEDVTVLLKDITGLVEPLPASVREKKIQAGTNYCEMLPLEYRPSAAYMAAYEHALDCYAKDTADAVRVLAEKLWQKKGENLVLVSLARAGIPVGILLKRYIRKAFGREVPHYAISIIRGRGIDRNALDYILKRHVPSSLQFVDGWTGKGAILTQLHEALAGMDGIDDKIGVLSDPAGLTQLCGTHEDILIPSSCLNATVTGLLSRTFLRPDIIGEQDFHGAAYYAEWENEDLSEAFLEAIGKEFTFPGPEPQLPEPQLPQPQLPQSQSDEHSHAEKAGQDSLPALNCPDGRTVVAQVAALYGIRDINLIKPGIGEATRVLLRRIPWKILINSRYLQAPELSHIRQLAREKGVPCEESRTDLGNYKVCGLIRDLSDL